VTGWIIAIGSGVVTALAIVLLGRLPRASWEIVAAALVLGLAGYAWQGNPGLPGSPRAAAATAPKFDEELAKRRRALGERLGPASQWLIVSDAMGRQGKTRESANVLVSALREHPRDANLWLGLGNALVAHGGGIVSPSADFAFRRAEQIEPDAPAAAYFHGLALARSGQLEQARKVWGALAARLPADDKLREELIFDLLVIARALGERPDGTPLAAPR
jgi:cytochrome c-type biogenesis protein CcmH/NrfG